MAVDETRSGKEKRKFQRLAISITACLGIGKPLLIRWLPAKEINTVISDISEGGFSILTKHNVAVSTPISIEFMLYKTDKVCNFKIYKTIRTRGKIKSKIPLKGRQYRLGVCFERLSEEDKNIIVNFVKTGINSQEIKELPPI
jgi:hypothetical protein